jgi:hypothetical protein
MIVSRGWKQADDGLFHNTAVNPPAKSAPPVLFFVETVLTDPQPEMLSVDLKLAKYVRMDAVEEILSELVGYSHSILHPTQQQNIMDRLLKLGNPGSGVPSDVPDKTLPDDLQECEKCGGITDKGYPHNCEEDQPNERD